MKSRHFPCRDLICCEKTQTLLSQGLCIGSLIVRISDWILLRDNYLASLVVQPLSGTTGASVMPAQDQNAGSSSSSRVSM